jgi:hypothetical protein
MKKGDLVRIRKDVEFLPEEIEVCTTGIVGWSRQCAPFTHPNDANRKLQHVEFMAKELLSYDDIYHVVKARAVVKIDQVSYENYAIVLNTSTSDETYVPRRMLEVICPIL